MRPGVAGGIENLARSFLPELQRLDSRNPYTVLVPSVTRYDFSPRPNFRFVACDGPCQLIDGLWLGVTHWSGLAGRGWARNRPGEHGPGAVLSLSGYIQQDLHSLPNLLLAVDLQHEYYPEFFSAGALAGRRSSLSISVRQAARVIAISNHTRLTLLEKLPGLAEDRVSVAHLAADPRFEPSTWRDRDMRPVLTKYRLQPGEYILYPANTWHHKNHRVAIEALALLRA